MRPCQQCNAPIGNSETVCPACGAEQQATVGINQGPAESTVPASDDPDKFHWLDWFLTPGSGDPMGCLAALAIVLLAVLFIIYTMNPVAAGIMLGLSVVALVATLAMIDGG